MRWNLFYRTDQFMCQKRRSFNVHHAHCSSSLNCCIHLFMCCWVIYDHSPYSHWFNDIFQQLTHSMHSIAVSVCVLHMWCLYDFPEHNLNSLSSVCIVDFSNTCVCLVDGSNYLRCMCTVVITEQLAIIVITEHKLKMKHPICSFKSI